MRSSEDFHNSVQGLKMDGLMKKILVLILIPIVSNLLLNTRFNVSHAKQLFYDLYEANTKLYSRCKHYFFMHCRRIGKQGKSSCYLGTNDGATGAIIIIGYRDSVFRFCGGLSHK